MLGFLSFLAVLSGIAFVVAALLLLARLIQKKPKKLPAIVSAVSLIAFCALSVWVSEIYEPTEKPAQDSGQGIAESGPPADTEKLVKETESKKDADMPEEEPGTAVPETEIKTASAKPGRPSGATPAKDNADSKPPSTKQPESKPKIKASEKPPIQKEPEKAGQAEPETASTETDSKQTETDSTSTEIKEPDTETIRSLFDALITAPEYQGAIISIEPRTINGEVYSWSIIDVVVPDAWYYLENYQKERYCTNVGDYIRAALVTGNVTEDGLGCSIHFYDAAGVEVAKSKFLGGYKVIK